MRMIEIILAQIKDVTDGGQDIVRYRIAKLVGAVHVETIYDAGRKHILHVGDLITERVADDLANCKRYKVTVTAQRGGAQ